MWNYKIRVEDKLNAHVNVSIFIHSILKYTIQRYTPLEGKYHHAITIPLTVLFSPILFIALWVMTIWRCLVWLVLRGMLQERLYKLFNGDEAAFQILDLGKQRFVITVLLMVQFPESDEELHAAISEEVKRIVSKEKLAKLRCLRKRFLGYGYYETCELDWAKFVGKFTCADMEQLLENVATTFEDPLPVQNTAMWDCKVGVRKIEDLYPVIFRFHHSTGDAAAIFNIFSTEFNTGPKVCKIMVQNPKPSRPILPLESTLKDFPLIDDGDSNCFCRSDLSDKKRVFWYTEKQANYLNLVKEVKKKDPSTRFMDVLLTAFSASMRDYAEKIDNSSLSMSVCVPSLPHSEFKYGEQEEYELTNKITIGLLTLPLTLKEPDITLSKRLSLVKEEYRRLKHKTIDEMVNRWQAIVLYKLLPLPVCKFLFPSTKKTALLSNIPGCDHLEIVGGASVQNLAIFDPNILRSGVSLMVTSYESKLNFAFTLDTAVVPNAQDGEDICRNTIRHFDKLCRYKIQ